MRTESQNLPCQIRTEEEWKSFPLGSWSFTVKSLYLKLATVSVVLGGRNWLRPASPCPQIILVRHYLQISWFSFKLAPPLFLPFLPFGVSFLLLFTNKAVCMSVHSVAQLCLTLCDPMDWSPPGSSVHGIFQARILKSVAISYCRGFSQPRDQTHISCIFCIGRQILYYCATWEACHKCINFH